MRFLTFFATVCLGVAVLVAVPPTHARIVSPDAAKGLPVTGFELEGVPDNLTGPLRSGLFLSGEKKLLRTQFPRFYEDLLQADLDRIRLYLAARGYPKAQARASVDLRENKSGDRVHLRIKVEPGPAIYLTAAQFHGLEKLPRRPERYLTFEPGDRFTDRTVVSSRAALTAALMEQGHARATVDAEVSPADPSTVTIAFTAQPGAVFHFGKVSVEGVSPDLIDLVEKTLAIDEGRRFDPRVLTVARDDLRYLGLFRQVRIETQDRGEILDVRCVLSAREPRRLEAGVGYWTDERVRVHARWVHKNLFDGGRGLEVGGSYSAFTKQVNTATWWPSLVGPRTRLRLSGGGQLDTETNYEQLTVDAELSLTYRLDTRSFTTGGLNTSYNTVTATTEVNLAQPGLLTILFADLNLDTADDQIWPTRGSVTRFRAEWGPPWPLSQNFYAAGSVYRTEYRRVGPFIYAGRANFGVSVPTGESVDLLPSKRYFSGGANTHRGFSRRRLGPEDQNGEPLGGEALIELSAEVRFPLPWYFEGAVFADLGNVWSEVEAIRPADLKLGIGPAIMVRTPVGPIRLDVGFLMSDVPSVKPHSDVQLHILVGNPY